MKHNKFTKYIGITVAIFVSLFTTQLAFADVPNLVVNFESEPLFSEVNFLPGNEVVRTVEVTNNSDSEQNIIIEAINSIDESGLGDELNVVIWEDDGELYNDTLSEFLRNGEVSLTSLASGNSEVYSFGITFNGDADNDTQESSLGFDLCVGFEGGDSNCGNTVIGEEEDTVGGSGSGGGTTIPGTGGGGGGGPTNWESLHIEGESVADTDLNSGTALIEWETNLLSTSQVVYGLESAGPYSLNPTIDPYFGYPLGTIENTTKVTSHSVQLTGLVPNQTYIYRVVSRASPPTIGFEQSFDFTDGVQLTHNTGSSLINENDGEVNTQESTKYIPKNTTYVNTIDDVIDVTEEDVAIEGEEMFSKYGAAVGATMLGELSPWAIGLIIFLLILLFLIIMWLLRRKREFDNKK